MSISGETAIVRVLGNHDLIDPRIHELEIDSWLQGFAGSAPTSSVNKHPVQATPQTTCGSNERYDAMCWSDSHPAEYERTYGVAMLVTSTGEQCTAWRVGSSNRMFTAQHCISSQEDLDGAEIWFNYEASSCDSGTAREAVKVSVRAKLEDPATAFVSDGPRSLHPREVGFTEAGAIIRTTDPDE